MADKKPRVNLSHEQKAKATSLWLKAKASGVSIDSFLSTLLQNHPDLEDKNVPGEPPSKASLINKWQIDPRYNTGVYVANPDSPIFTPSKATSRTGANLIAEFEAQYKQQKDQALLEFLEGAVKDLEAQLAAAQSQLRNHKEEMGLIEPSIEQ